MSSTFSSRITVLFIAMLGTAASQAQVTYTAGDILVGFQATGGTGAGNNYVYNLGQGSSFRSATAAVNAATIGADLAEVYGTNWFTRTDLLWTIAGVRTNATFGAEASSVVNGDPARTLYISKGASGLGTSTPNSTLASGAVGTGATRMMDAQSGFRTLNGTLERTATPGSGGRGVIQGTGDINSWSSRVDNTPFTIFTSNVKQAFGTAGALSYLDLYRILGRNDLAGIVEPAGVGVSVLQGTFTINTAGNIRFEPPVTASGYDAWADSFSLVGADRAFDVDLDGDGLDNGTEFVVGGHPRSGADGDKFPTLSAGAGVAEFVFRRVDASAYLTSVAEYDADLLGPWTTAINGVGGVSVNVVNDGFAVGVDRVTVRIPVTGPVQFVRLRVAP
jgi:hypothetical protein